MFSEVLELAGVNVDPIAARAFLWLPYRAQGIFVPAILDEFLIVSFSY
jgi:hypothetical protein